MTYPFAALVSAFLVLATPARAAAGRIEGRISLSPALKKAKIADTAALYVIARPAGAQGGMPLAVLRLPAQGFPVAFSLSQDNVMMQGSSFSGKVQLSARVAQSGSATPVSAGDLEMKKPLTVEVGKSGVELKLDRVH
jgi:hypothetical protein